MEIVQACDRQLLYSRMAPLVQREVISSGPGRKEKLLTMSPWPLPLSPSPFFYFFPDRKSGLRCQAVSWGPSRVVSGGGPHPELHSDGGVRHWSGHFVVLPWRRGTQQQQLVACLMAPVNRKLNFSTISSHQTNSLVEMKSYREALSHATEAVSILTIHSVNVTDTGTYSCNVTSMDTTQTQQTQVIVYGKHQLRTVHMYYLAPLLFNSLVNKVSVHNKQSKTKSLSMLAALQGCT